MQRQKLQAIEVVRKGGLVDSGDRLGRAIAPDRTPWRIAASAHQYCLKSDVSRCQRHRVRIEAEILLN